MDDNPKDPDQEKKGSYGKKPLWFWILVYAIVGVIIYAIIYFLFFSTSSIY